MSAGRRSPPPSDGPDPDRVSERVSATDSGASDAVADRDATAAPGAAPPGGLVLIRRVARLMDDAVEIPVLGIRVGLDSVIGLIPGGGDVAGAAMGGWIVVQAARMGASPSVLGRMLMNLGLDALIGAVPLLGDLFDLVFKANRRNVQILEDHIRNPDRTRTRSRKVVWGTVAGVVGLVLALIVAVGWLLVTLARLAIPGG